MKKIYFFAIGIIICLIFFFVSKRNLNQYTPFSDRDDRELRDGTEMDRDEEVLARIKQEVLMTKDPQLGYVPTERLEAARQQLTHKASAQTLGMNSGSTILSTGLTWSERGPSNIGGRCRAVLIDKSDASGNTVYAGSVSGGLWKSTNFTSGTPAWVQISSVSANLAITTLAQDPSNSSIMYAGTGEGYFNVDALRGLGIYKSTDGGASWSLLASTTTGGAQETDFNYIQKIAVYSNGDVYASGISATFCNRGGILKSTDGGTTWTRVIGVYSGGGSCSNAVDFNGYDIAFSASGDIYASTVDYSTGTPAGKIYKSSAGATVGNSGTWTNFAPSAGTGNYWQRIQIACSPSNNNRLYAIFQGTGNGITAMERSDDGGSTWTNITNTTNWCDQGSSTSKDFSRGQAWYDLVLTINPNNDAIVYAGGVDVMTTSNSGSSWSQLTQWASGCSSLPYVHADIHNITFAPGSSTNFIVGCDGGIFYTSNGGSSFSSKDNGLNVTQYYAAAINPNSGSNDMLAGAQDNGSHVFSTTGINSVATATGGDGAFCFIDQNNPNYQITSYTDAAYSRSTNGGTSFSIWTNSTNGRFINPADYDNTTQYLYCAYTDTKLRRVGTITSASPTGTTITVSSNTSLQVSAVKVDPNTTDSVWVAFSTADDATSNQVPQLYVIGGASTGTRTTTQITSLSLTSGSYISSIDVEKGNKNHLLITVSNYGVASVWESTDKGATWTSLDNNGVNLPDVPVRWGMIIPSTANVGTGGPNGGIMLATELGVWSTITSNNTSTIWTQNSTGIGNVSTYMLKWRPVDNVVVAATHGRGLFTTTLLSSPLPITFVSFSGNAMDKLNRLNWSIQNETNSKGYFIERKYADENSFASVGFIKSENLQTGKYTFDDESIDLGKQIAEYRLRQVDLDGNSNYSTVISLKRKASSKFVEYIFVNGNNLFVRLNNENSNQLIYFEVFDISGRLLINKSISYESQNLDISRLAKGTYVLKLSGTNGAQYAQKFVK
ncbi:MAG TPA: T9SS type A sorting domain-containing protein [Puia sp.]|nr:T9SS type A sorting domain-containing protein [Puia sp.]